MYPRVLYSCELWNTISQTDISKLESTLLLCLKNAQNLISQLDRLVLSRTFLKVLNKYHLENTVDEQGRSFESNLEAYRQVCDIQT